MSEDIKTTEQQPTNSTPEESGEQGERLFTQAEVNKIVAERLARERAKSQPTEADAKLAEAEAKLEEAAQKERRIECREYLVKNGLPVGLEDFLDTSSLPAFIDTVRGVVTIFDKAAEEPRERPWKPPTGEALLRTAFGLERKD